MENEEICCEYGCDCCSPEQNRAMQFEQLFKLIVSIVLFIAGYIIVEYTTLPNFIYLICFGISYLLVGFSIVRNALEGIINGRIFNEHLMMTIASLGAFVLKEYSEGCAVVILYTIGEMLQSRAVAKSRGNVLSAIGDDNAVISRNSSSDQFITKFARIYTPIVCAIAILIVAIPPLFMHESLNEWVRRGLSALVISCPCAIVVSVPLCFFGGIVACSKNGIYVADSSCIERLKNYTADITSQKAKSDGIIIEDISKEKIATGAKIARRTIRLAMENIAISVLIKIVILVLDVFLAKEIPMWLAAFSDIGICLLAILNSLRALKK